MGVVLQDEIQSCDQIAGVGCLDAPVVVANCKAGARNASRLPKALSQHLPLRLLKGPSEHKQLSEEQQWQATGSGGAATLIKAPPCLHVVDRSA